MSSLKYFFASFIDDFQSIGDDIKSRKIRNALDDFDGKSCVISFGEYHEEDGSFTVTREHPIYELQIQYNYNNGDSPIVYDYSTGERITTLTDPSSIQRIIQGDGVIFNTLDSVYDIMITSS
jgi:hypothetical protein